MTKRRKLFIKVHDTGQLEMGPKNGVFPVYPLPSTISVRSGILWKLHITLTSLVGELGKLLFWSYAQTLRLGTTNAS